MLAVDSAALDTAADWIKIAIFGVGGAGGGFGIFFVLRQLVITLWNTTRADNERLRTENKDLLHEVRSARADTETERAKRITAEKRADKAEDLMDDMRAGRTPIDGGRSGRPQRS